MCNPPLIPMINLLCSFYLRVTSYKITLFDIRAVFGYLFFDNYDTVDVMYYGRDKTVQKRERKYKDLAGKVGYFDIPSNRERMYIANAALVAK